MKFPFGFPDYKSIKACLLYNSVLVFLDSAKIKTKIWFGFFMQAPDVEGIAIGDLISTLMNSTYLPLRSEKGPFIFAVDHCFSIRGQGTVMTGTALSGKVCVNDV